MFWILLKKALSDGISAYLYRGEGLVPTSAYSIAIAVNSVQARRFMRS
jgi:hypothetical protein